jgi:hypothetical protein
MHPTLTVLKAELKKVSTQVKSLPSNEPLNMAHNDSGAPGLTRDELVKVSDYLIDLIDNHANESPETNELLLVDYLRRLEFLRLHTIDQIWGENCAQAVASYLTTLEGLKQALLEAFHYSEVNPAELSKLLQKLAKQVKKVAADSTLDRDAIKQAKDEALKYSIILKTNATDAEAIIALCDDAYRSKTNENLSRAFADRSKEITETIWLWVFGLVIALIVGGLLGSMQLSSLNNLIKNNINVQNNFGFWIELILTVLFIGAPIWFAIVATRQIGQRFRLAEDYAYKAAISKAYEGYRREAEKFSSTDPEFQARLFSAALSRLEELPLRLIEKQTYKNPWPNWLYSIFIKKTVASASEFAGKMSTLSKSAMTSSGKDKHTVSPESEKR